MKLVGQVSINHATSIHFMRLAKEFNCWSGVLHPMTCRTDQITSYATQKFSGE